MKKLFVIAFSFALLMSCADDENLFTYPDAPKNPDQARLLQMVNEARAQGQTCDLEPLSPVPPISWSSALAQVAQKHSEDMNAADRLSHRGTNGSFLDERLESEGYIAVVWAENLAVGVETEMEVIQEWLASPGHCENIMLPDVLEMGVGTSGPYWTMVLAAK